MRRRWKTVRHRLQWFVLLLLVLCVPRLPRRAVVSLANGIGSLVYRCDWRGRNLALANIASAFGDRFSPAERSGIVRSAYRDLSRTMLDLLWAPALTRENYRRYIEIENIEVLQRLRQRGESAALLCIHQGNFEWASLAAGFAGFPTTIVAEQLTNPWVEQIFRACREVSGHRIIPQRSSVLRLLKHVRRGGLAGLLVDLNCRPREGGTVIQTFGLAMCATCLHAVLALRGGARLVPIEGRSQPDGSCRVIIHEPLEVPMVISERELTQHCWDYFAQHIENEPELWMWMYRHWRFVPPGDLKQYPFYAQSNPDFDQLYQAASGAEPGAGVPQEYERELRYG